MYMYDVWLRDNPKHARSEVSLKRACKMKRDMT